MKREEQMATLVESARLWDAERPALKARQWSEGEWWRDFLRLKPSHVAGLQTSVYGAASPKDFMDSLEAFTAGAAKRGKGASPWERKRGAVALKDRLTQGLVEAERDTIEARNPQNDAFAAACRQLRELDPKLVDVIAAGRRLTILKDFLAALIVRYRARKFLPRTGGES
jgi:hypothetical protein